MIDLPLDEHQAQIIDSVRAFLQQDLPLARLRNEARPPVTALQWRRAAELGLFGIGLEESLGGIGLGAIDEALVMRELGRVVASPSFLATTLAAHLAAEAGRVDWCAQLLGGERRAHLVVAGPRGRDALCIDRRDAADGALLLAAMPDEFALLEHGFQSQQEVQALDGAATAIAGTLDLAASAIRVGADNTAGLHARLLLSAQLAGLAEGALALAVDYAKTRQQFGRPIGSFQAVKHRCADMAMKAYIAWAQIDCAARALDAGADTAASEVAAAKWLAADAAHRCADGAIQVHGAIGYQAEYDTHQFMKRAHLQDQAGGAQRVQARMLAVC